MNKKMDQFSMTLEHIATLISDRQFQDAEVACRRLHTTNPDHPGTHYLTGTLCYRMGKYHEAQIVLEKAHMCMPGEQECRKSLLSCYIESGQTEKALSTARRFLGNTGDGSIQLLIFTLFCNTCCWDEAQALQQKVFDLVLKGESNIASVLPGFLFVLNGLENIDRELLFSLHKSAKVLLEQQPPNLPATNDLDHGSRIRIAYLSPDFRDHPVSYFIYPILCHHDKEQFAVYCYSSTADKDHATESIANSVEHFVDVTQMSDAELARRIRQDQIQILVDLSGHTRHSRVAVLGMRPAPIQVTYLGYPNTTGLPGVDYRITDHFAEDPLGTQYTEKLLYLPESFLCYGMQPNISRNYTSAARNCGYISFGSFANPHKLNRTTIRLWSLVLRKTKNSIMYFKSRLDSESVQNNIINEFKEYGIASDRIRFLPLTEGYDQHLEHYNQIDVALDTFPYAGTTTTFEALMMGVPVITLVGKLHCQRVGYSIMKNIGFEETITYTTNEYVDKAVQLSQNIDGLDILRKTLPMLIQHSITGSPAAFARQLEELYLISYSNIGKRIKDFRAD